MIPIKLDDTIIDIIQKIESHEHNWDIILDIPVWHPLLHNYISLKILKNKAPKGKKLIIVTSDRLSRKIWQQLWIEYSLIRNKDIVENSSKNEILKKNFSIYEYFWYQIKYYKNELFEIFQNNKSFNKLTYQAKWIQDKAPTGILLFLFFITLAIFFSIYYTAVSKTFITIRPEISVRKEALNFTLTEEQSWSILWTSRNIEVKRINKITSIRERFSASIKEAKDDQRASGKVRIYNNTNEKISLVPNTRFMSENWVVYDIDSWIQVPAGSFDNFWEGTAWFIDVTVWARATDSSWNISWLRWNIESWSKLTLPGLSESMQEQIYAEALENFQWWSEEFISRISQNDIDLAKQIVSERLRNQVLEELRADIWNNNILNNVQKSLLTLPQTLDFWTPQIRVLENLKAWDIADSFEIEGVIELKWFAYNEGEIIQRLRRRVNERQLEWIEKILQVDTSSLKAIELLSRQNSPFRLKASFEIEVISEHDFLHDNNSYIDILKERIRWVEASEAERILLNDIFVSRVEIQNRPFFRKHISKLPRNIHFTVQSNER